MLDDFEKLLVLLFSEESQTNAKYRQDAKGTETRIPPPETKLDIVQRIWQKTIPVRELIIGCGKVETRVKEKTSQYNASKMSDGERVIFYLIGQCLVTPANGVIIIDEPELHLHKAIQSSLWDLIEAAKPDCLFVYLTHDLEFAASRAAAKKICLKEFSQENDQEKWDWFEVPEIEDIPEQIVLKIVGSRKPVLFVEGDKSKLDHYLYSHLYPGFTITPCGAGDHVIHATASFGARKMLHRLHCCGLIDRDYRSDERVRYLKERNVHVTDVSEVENLFLVEGVVRTVAKELLKDGDAIVEKVKDLVFTNLEREKQRVISSLAAGEIECMFSTFDAKAQGEAALAMAVQTLFASIDVGKFYNAATNRVSQILRERNYPEAIKIYNHKGLVPQMAAFFGQKSGPDFLDYLKKLVAEKRGEPVLAAMRTVLPTIEVPMGTGEAIATGAAVKAAT